MNPEDINLQQINREAGFKPQVILPHPGKVIEKTENSIKFITIRNEEYLLRDDELAWAKRNEGEY